MKQTALVKTQRAAASGAAVEPLTVRARACVSTPERRPATPATGGHRLRASRSIESRLERSTPMQHSRRRITALWAAKASRHNRTPGSWLRPCRCRSRLRPAHIVARSSYGATVACTPVMYRHTYTHPRARSTAPLLRVRTTLEHAHTRTGTTLECTVEPLPRLDLRPHPASLGTQL